MTDGRRQTIFILLVLALGLLTLASASFSQEGGSDDLALLKVLRTPNGVADDRFGTAAIIEGDTIVVGAPYEDTLGPDAGAVYIFERNAGGPENWGLAQKLTVSAAIKFGHFIDIDGNTLIVGTLPSSNAPSSAYIFERRSFSQGEWVLTKAFPEDSLNGFGPGVAIDGNTAMVRQAFGDPSIFVFERDNGGPDNWGQTSIIRGTASKRLGPMNLNDDTLLVMTPDSSNNRDNTYIHRRDVGGLGTWGQDGPGLGYYGYAIDLDGDLVAIGIGRPYCCSWGATLLGFDGSSLEVLKHLTVPEVTNGQRYGQSIALEGDSVLVMADPGFFGKAYLFSRNTGGPDNWGLDQELVAGRTIDRVATPIDISNNTVIIGAPGEDAAAGAVYVFGEPDRVHPTAEVLYPNGGEYWLLSDPDAEPNTEFVVWDMSDNIRICQAEVSLWYSNDGGVNYFEAATADLPETFGPGVPCDFPGVSDKSLSFTIPETPPSGSKGSLYKIQVRVTDHAGNVTVAESPNPFFMVKENPEPETLILANPSRMKAKMNLADAEVAELRLNLENLANHQEVDGRIVDLGRNTDLQALYAAWDADPDLANQVLFGCHHDLPGGPLPAGCDAQRDGVHDVVRDLLEVYPRVENLILVGDDRIIPMARIADRTDLFPENQYTSDDPSDLQAELSTHGTTVAQALADKLYLSDDPLATRGSVQLEELREEGHTFLPQLAVGRLVETPEEIAASIATFISQDGVLDLETAGADEILITAYDFLVDAAKRVYSRWLNTFGSAYLLNGQSWTEDDLLTKLCQLGGVGNLNGHATHFEEGVPGGGVHNIQGLDTVEMLAPNACGERRLELNGRVIYAVGCHGGLPVAGSTVPSDPELDLPQAFLSRGVMAYLANSGYAWGLRWGVGYSERLVELFTEELTRGGTVVLGEAVKNAKLRYFMESPRFDAYSEKTLMQWTFFGFPMYRIKTGIPEEPEPDALLQPVAKQRAALEKLGAVTVERRELSRSVAAKVELPDYLTQVNLRFNLSAVGVYEKYQASGDPELAPGCTDPNGCYYRLNGLVEWETGTADLPLQPFLVYDSRLSGTSQHGVLWMGGAYDVEHDFPPVFAELISNGGDGSDPGVLPRKIYRKPRWPRRRLFGGNRDCRATDNEVSSIVLTTGESVLGPDGTFSTQRLYRDIDLEAFYFNNPQDPQQNCDRIGPMLGGGPHHQASGTRINWAVIPTDPSGIWRIVAVYDDEAQQRWVPVELTDDGNGTWRGHAIMGNAGTVSYFLQAVDQRGNVSWLDYESPRPPASAAPLGLPLPVDVPITPGEADLSVILVDSPDPVKPDELLVYTLFVENHGPDPASSIDVSQTLDSDLRFLDATGDGWSCEWEDPVVTCSRESLGVGTSPAISISARAPASTGTLASHATASSVEADLDPTDNSKTQTTGVVENSFADIEVFKTGRAIPGSANEIRYTITVINHGPHSVSGVTVIDQFPSPILPATVLWTCQASAGAACSAGGNGHIQDSGVALPAGGRVRYDATANAAPGFSGIVESSASVSLPGFVVDGNLDNNQSSLAISLPPPGLEIFADGFEIGSFLAWSSIVSAEHVIDDVVTLRNLAPKGESIYRGRLIIEPGSLDLKESETHLTIAVDDEKRPVFALGLIRTGKAYNLILRKLLGPADSTIGNDSIPYGFFESEFLHIDSNRHVIDVEWQLSKNGSRTTDFMMRLDGGILLSDYEPKQRTH